MEACLLVSYRMHWFRIQINIVLISISVHVSLTEYMSWVVLLRQTWRVHLFLQFLHPTLLPLPLNASR